MHASSEVAATNVNAKPTIQAIPSAEPMPFRRPARRSICAHKALAGTPNKATLHATMFDGSMISNSMSRAARSAQQDWFCSKSWPSNPPGTGLRPQSRCSQTLLNGYRYSGRRATALVLESVLRYSRRGFGRVFPTALSAALGHSTY